MTTDECRVWRERIGALVLGQLGLEERVATEAHLEGCPDCRAEADALAPMASMLRRADPERLAPSPLPPPELAERITQRIAAERRKSRRRKVRFGFGLAAAAAAATAAVLLALSLTGSPNDAQPVQTVTFRHLPRNVSVSASLAPRPYGSDVRVMVHGFRPGALCMVWLRDRDGTKIPAGSFRYVWGGEDATELSSGIDPPHVTAVGLTVGSRTFVAHVPRAGRAAKS
jgi:anti-sigma factor RsiW